MFAAECVPGFGAQRKGSWWQLALGGVDKLRDSVNAKPLYFYLASSASSVIILERLNPELKSIRAQPFLRRGLLSLTTLLCQERGGGNL